MYESNFVFYTACVGMLRGKMQMLKIQDPSYYITTLLTSSVFIFVAVADVYYAGGRDVGFDSSNDTKRL